jgi:hypothetical protein
LSVDVIISLQSGEFLDDVEVYLNALDWRSRDSRDSDQISCVLKFASINESDDFEFMYEIGEATFSATFRTIAKLDQFIAALVVTKNAMVERSKIPPPKILEGA